MQKLKAYHSLHGNDWKKIGAMVARSSLSVALKFSQIGSRKWPTSHETSRTGSFSPLWARAQRSPQARPRKACLHLSLSVSFISLPHVLPEKPCTLCSLVEFWPHFSSVTCNVTVVAVVMVSLMLWKLPAGSLGTGALPHGGQEGFERRHAVGELRIQKQHW
jgi:hypothetical protein